MPEERSYTREEVNAILARAVERQHRDLTTHKELVEAAREIGLGPEAIDAAAREVEASRGDEEERRRVREKLRRRLFNHAFSYVLVMAFLLAVNLLTSTAYMWVVWPALGWGLGLMFHLRAALFPDDRRLARAARRERKRTRVAESRAQEKRTRVAPVAEEELLEDVEVDEARMRR